MGVLEQILAAVLAQNTILQQIAGATPAVAATATIDPAAAALAQQQAAAQQAAAQQAAAQQASTVTEKDLMDLITPAVSGPHSEVLKPKLTAALQAMGVAGLSALTPDKFGAAYAALKAVIDQHGAASAGNAGGLTGII